MHSFADRFISKSDYYNLDPTYPLTCSLCDECGFVQLECVTTPEARYDEFAYSYTSSNSSSSIAYWSTYAQSVLSALEIFPESILEVGSNDGQLMSEFISKGIPSVVGVDASPVMCSLANRRGLQTYNSFFGKQSVSLPHHSQGYLDLRYDLIVANNVLNHSNDPLDFLATAASLLTSPSSYVVFEVPYWGALVGDFQFDQIYHEHVSYLTLENSTFLAKQAGLNVTHAEMSPYHGGSIRVYCQPASSTKPSSQYFQLLEDERKLNLRDHQIYLNLKNHIIKNRQSLHKIIDNFVDSGRKIVCIGAAAKANTFLTYMGLNSTNVHFITDSSDSKIGKFTPLTRIPVRHDAAISELSSPLCIVTSWNLFDILEPIIKKINPSATVLSSRQLL